jgi:hypothetical protein
LQLANADHFCNCFLRHEQRVRVLRSVRKCVHLGYENRTSQSDMKSPPHIKRLKVGTSLARAGVIAAYTMLPIEVGATETALGKYFCYVSDMAGIQVSESGQVSSGNFAPKDEKLFIDIHPAVHPKNLCSNPASKEFSDWFVCNAAFEVQINNRPRLRGDNSLQFTGGPLLGQFYLSDDGTFHHYQTILTSGGFFVSDGKCTKI